MIKVSIVVLGVIAVVVGILTPPFFRTPKSMMGDVLKFTPMGTHIDEVAEIVRNQTVVRNVNEWREPTISYDSGYVDPFGEVPGWPTIAKPRSHTIVGHQSVRVYYETRSRIYIYISVYWGFDEEGKLIDVFLTKSLDIFPFGSIRRTAD